MNLALEKLYGMERDRWIVGIDEVGRGPIAGPVVAAAVVFPAQLLLEQAPDFLKSIRDSKKLAPKQRCVLAQLIKKNAFYALGAASVCEIGRYNILQASLKAMQRACAKLGQRLGVKAQDKMQDKMQGKMQSRAQDMIPSWMPHAYLIDGRHSPSLRMQNIQINPQKIKPIVQGDNKSITIASAAIIAKVARDALMEKLHAQYPLYAWQKNMGYPVPEHLKALEKNGLSPHHRKTFAPCMKFLV